PQVLALHARRVIAPLAATGLVDDPDRAEGVGREVRNDRTDALLEGIASGGVVPPGGDQELLEGSYRGTGFEGDRLDALPWQVGQQPAAVSVEVLGSPVLA